jgi:hypothetical protein
MHAVDTATHSQSSILGILVDVSAPRPRVPRGRLGATATRSGGQRGAKGKEKKDAACGEEKVAERPERQGTHSCRGREGSDESALAFCEPGHVGGRRWSEQAKEDDWLVGRRGIRKSQALLECRIVHQEENCGQNDQRNNGEECNE